MGDTDKPNVSSTVQGAAAIIRLERPEKLNAFTTAMVEETREAVMEAASDPEVVGLVITGEGRGFTAGLDTGDLTRAAEGALPASPRPDDELPALFSFVLNVPKPVIAAVNGVSAGGGFVLAMLCDLRFAAPEASFTTAFSKRGLIAEHGTSWFLPRLVGTSRALDLLWSARRIDAEEALRIGLVDRIVPAERLIDECCAYVDDLAANVSRRSMAVMKSQVYRGLSLSVEDALRESTRVMNEALDHPDAKEGVVSFLERRPPNFERLSGP
jgi:enoyl-CoA hydratase/carnithine racemase